MPKKHPKEDRSRKVSTSSQRSGETVSSRPLGSTSESEEPIELLSPKHNGNSVDSSIKQHNKSSIKGMWKKAFRSIRSNKPKDGEKDKTEGDRDSKHSRTTLRTFRRSESIESTDSSRQSSLKRVLRRKDSKEEKPEEEYSRDEDPVYQTLKRAASMPVPMGSASAAGSSLQGSLNIVDEEYNEDSHDPPSVRPSSSSYRHSYHEYH